MSCYVVLSYVMSVWDWDACKHACVHVYVCDDDDDDMYIWKNISS